MVTARKKSKKGGKKMTSTSIRAHKANIYLKKITAKKKIIGSKSKIKTKIETTVQDKMSALEILKKNLPMSLGKEVQDAFEELKRVVHRLENIDEKKIKTDEPSIDTPKIPAARPPNGEMKPNFFDPLNLMRRVLISHDLLFLSRQVSYHIAAESNLPEVYANQDQIQFVFSQLVEHLVRRSTRNASIDISVKKFSLRTGRGLEISFSSEDRDINNIDQQGFLAELFHGNADNVSGITLSDCRRAVLRQHGQLWVDFPVEHNPVYHLVLPSTEQAMETELSSQQTFKYDIAITNFYDMRKRFGIKKSQSLVSQIEHYIRSLVRYPIDVVMSLGDKGVITTIYDTQKGSAQSVASRISERLGTEIFRVGKKPVDISFSYHLSPLATQSIQNFGLKSKDSVQKEGRKGL